jgi:hypothetical protein
MNKEHCDAIAIWQVKQLPWYEGRKEHRDGDERRTVGGTKDVAM